ncbi:hypothetical protein FRX31_018812 [Thalictrum thalictroides]|uniref:Uncharacterized protein n=1 Tax=Thalictrum thalictroides TaxID=46969 RepID=A0A7J6W501_THATH|nr:hypothetical protein FRX31_018812 [Thalictrum thalictroides]
MRFKGPLLEHLAHTTVRRIASVASFDGTVITVLPHVLTPRNAEGFRAHLWSMYTSFLLWELKLTQLHLAMYGWSSNTSISPLFSTSFASG